MILVTRTMARNRFEILDVRFDSTELMRRRVRRVEPKYPPRILSRDAYYGAVTFDFAERPL